MTPDDLMGFSEEVAEFIEDKPTKYDSRDNNPVEQAANPKQLIRWLNKTRNLPLEAIDHAIVHQSYPAVVWEFRAAALAGKLNRAKALECWLKWAAPIIARPIREKSPTVKTGNVAFLPREPGKEDE